MPIDRWLQANVSQTVTDPFPRESSDANASLINTTIAIGVTMAVVFASHMALALVGRRVFKSEVLQTLRRVDLLFSARHAFDEHQYFQQYATWLGGLFSVMAVCLLALLAPLLMLQNLTVPQLTTSISTAPPPLDPTGAFALQVTAFGSDFTTACASMSLTPLNGDWVGTVAPVIPVYAPELNSCSLTWRCVSCRIGARTLNPLFRFASAQPSWASFFNITLWTPALGGAGVDAFSVSQLFAPTDSLGDRNAFRMSVAAVAAGATPSVVLQLTSFTVASGSGSSSRVRTTFQPSISSTTAEPVSGAPPMTPSSPTDLLAVGAAAGFQLQVQLQRNTFSIAVTAVDPTIVNLVTLVLSAFTSLLSGLGFLFQITEKYLRTEVGSLDETGSKQTQAGMALNGSSAAAATSTTGSGEVELTVPVLQLMESANDNANKTPVENQTAAAMAGELATPNADSSMTAVTVRSIAMSSNPLFVASCDALQAAVPAAETKAAPVLTATSSASSAPGTDSADVVAATAFDVGQSAAHAPHPAPPPPPPPARPPPMRRAVSSFPSSQRADFIANIDVSLHSNASAKDNVDGSVVRQSRPPPPQRRVSMVAAANGVFDRVGQQQPQQ